MTLEHLKAYAEGVSKIYPQLEDEVRDLYFLADMEVELGSPVTNVYELAISSIKELIADLDRI